MTATEAFRLPDGRMPVRLQSERSAWYTKLRGEGEVLYKLSTIRALHKRPRLTKEELHERAVARAKAIKAKDPHHYEKAGAKGGTAKKGYRRGRKNFKNA